ELTRVPAPVKADVTAHPLQIRLLSAQREVARAHPLARDRKEARHSILGRSGLAEGRHGASPDAMEAEPRVGIERQMRRVCRVSRCCPARPAEPYLRVQFARAARVR